VDEGLRMTAPEGTYLEIGNINVGWKAEFDPSWIIFGNRRIIGLAHYEAEHLRGALDLMLRTLTKYPWRKVSPTSTRWRRSTAAFAEQDRGARDRARRSSLTIDVGGPEMAPHTPRRSEAARRSRAALDHPACWRPVGEAVPPRSPNLSWRSAKPGARYPNRF